VPDLFLPEKSAGLIFPKKDAGLILLGRKGAARKKVPREKRCRTYFSAANS